MRLTLLDPLAYLPCIYVIVQCAPMLNLRFAAHLLEVTAEKSHLRKRETLRLMHSFPIK